MNDKELIDDREALKRTAEAASEQRLKESIGEWRKALGAANDSFPDDWELEFWHAGYKHGALAMIEHQLSRAAVPDAATDLPVMRKMVEEAKQNPGGVEWQTFWDRLTEDQIIELLDAISVARAERDAALAAIERMRAVCLHLGGVDGDVSQPAPSYYVSVGRNVVATEVLAALDGAPEPEETEWVYRARNSILNSGAHVSEEAARATLQLMIENHSFEVEPEPVFVERRPRFAWLPVEGSES